MSDFRQKYYPTVMQAIHLIILYMFIQSIVDFPLAMIDYFKDTEYLYNPFKKVFLGVGSTLFILVYGFRKSGKTLFEVFPVKYFNLLIIIPIITFLWSAHRLLEIPARFLDTYLPAPAWFWEMFEKIFEGDFGFWGAFTKVAIVAPVIEELIFRGIILNGFKRNYSPAKAVVISALLFALFHLNPWQFPATFVLGLLLGWIFIRTDNIILAIVGHSINNSLVLIDVTYFNEIQKLGFFQMEKFSIYTFSLLIASVSVFLIWIITNKQKVKTASE